MDGTSVLYHHNSYGHHLMALWKEAAVRRTCARPRDNQKEPQNGIVDYSMVSGEGRLDYDMAAYCMHSMRSMQKRIHSRIDR